MSFSIHYCCNYYFIPMPICLHGWHGPNCHGFLAPFCLCTFPKPPFYHWADPRCPLTCIYQQVSEVPSCTTDGCVTVCQVLFYAISPYYLSLCSPRCSSSPGTTFKVSASRLQSVRVKREEGFSLNWLCILDTGLRLSKNRINSTKHW